MKFYGSDKLYWRETGFVSVSDISLGQETGNTKTMKPQQRKVGHFKKLYVNLFFFYVSILNLKF